MIDELDPKKFHVLTKKQKILAIVGVLLAMLIVIPPLGYWYYNFALNRPSQTSKEITFEIKSGDMVSEISDNLYETGAINSKFLFNFYAISSGLDRNIQAGLYTIDAGTSIKELVTLFQHGTLDHSITFLEGWRVEEFARKAALEFGNIDYYKFVELAKPYEGYLFPDTYIFNSDITEEEMVKHLRDVFDQKTEDLLSGDYLEKSGLTPEQAVIFASIIERETSAEGDRPVVAGILIKRWEEGMKIEADATTQYAVGTQKYSCRSAETCAYAFENIDWWKSDLTKSDLALESPYNTRLNLGLPPAPIASVSVSALQSVINYEPSEYYFYINDAQGDTHFATTLAEHNANVEKYLN